MESREGKLAEEATFQVVVLILKYKKDYRGIGLVEVMWKVVTAILNLWITASITFHDSLHRFWAGRGPGTAILKAKLLQKLASLKADVLYVILLYMHKGYDVLDRSMCLDILEGYSVGLHARRLLQIYWRRLTIISRAGGYYGTVFQVAHGVTQGDPLSPTIFNVVVDTLVQHWVAVVISGTEKQGERGQESSHQAALFYTYGGMVAS